MLSEAEQRRLTEIEARLSAEDPAFVQQFGEPGRGPRQEQLQRSRRFIAALLACAVVMIVVEIGIMVKSVGTVVVACSVIAALAGPWAVRRLRR
jgi:Flp pilus assembly protein TadB